MQTFLSGQDVTVTFDISNVEVTITSLAYKVIDGDDNELASGSLAYTAGDLEASVTVPALKNAISGNVTFGVRTVILYITGTGGASGQSMMTVSYRIITESRLPVPSASFITLAQAQALALDLVDVDAFIGASESDQVSALLQAHQNLCGMNYVMPNDDYLFAGYRLGIGRSRIDLITKSEFDSLDPIFRHALQKAQVIDAAEMLKRSKDEFSELRDQGVTSITIGESSRTWSGMRSAKTPASARAMRVLGRFISAKRITRS